MKLVNFRNKVIGDLYEFRGFTEEEYLAYKIAPIILTLLDANGGKWKGTAKRFFKKFMENAADLKPKFTKRVNTLQSLATVIVWGVSALRAAGIDFKKRLSKKGNGTIIALERLAT